MGTRGGRASASDLSTAAKVELTSKLTFPVTMWTASLTTAYVPDPSVLPVLYWPCGNARKESEWAERRSARSFRPDKRRAQLDTQITAADSGPLHSNLCQQSADQTAVWVSPRTIASRASDRRARRHRRGDDRPSQPFRPISARRIPPRERKRPQRQPGACITRCGIHRGRATVRWPWWAVLTVHSGGGGKRDGGHFELVNPTDLAGNRL